MNRYPVWKYAIIVIALLVGVIYTLPNFFGEAPAVQVSPGKPTVKVDSTTQARVEQALAAAGIKAVATTLENGSLKVRLDSGDVQLRAKDAIQKALVPDPNDAGYVVALNLLSASPKWLSALRAAPMYLGLDLRGGVHFLLQVDMQAALSKKAESLAGDLRSILREKNVRHSGINRNGQSIEVRFRDTQTLQAAKAVLADQFPDLQAVDTPEGSDYKLTAT
ncbi:MAG TPA: protein translocase subunit SecD, partial [Ramlibacter sp.]|nr:protein translocase subunit SecD [Ramlibacter sp.]